MNGVTGPGSSAVASGAVTRQAGTGRDLPFSRSGSTGSMPTWARTMAAVSAQIRTSPEAAAVCSRAAVLTESPTTRKSSPGRVITTTLPVQIPARASSSTPYLAARSVVSPARAASAPVAARTARSASSSRATVAPKAARIASPMNFSTTPPCSAMQAPQLAK